MIIMIFGMIGISVAVNYEQIKAARLKKQQQYTSINVYSPDPNEKTPLTYDDQPTYKEKEYKYVSKDQESNQYPGNPTDKPQESSDYRKFVLGIICALASGFFGATQNVPLKNAPPEAHGIQYIISFGIGALLVITIFTAIYCVGRLVARKGLPTVNLKLSAGPGALAGLLWSAGNVCNIYTVYAWGATVGFPLVMCNMMVAGCWGVFYYNEAPSLKMKIAFVFSCATLLGGVTILSLYG